jgi:hypothetical protein
MKVILGDADDVTELPAPFVATTAKVYAVFPVNPVISHVNAVVVVHVFEPGVEVTVYPVTADPPSDSGADQVTRAAPTIDVAVGVCGALGTVAGTKAAEATDGFESFGAELVATTVKVYEVPFVRPVTTQLSGPLVQVHVLFSGEEVTTYLVTAEPPLFAGAVQETVTC